MNYSIIMPCEENRLELFCNTFNKYINLGLDNIEIILVTRTITNNTVSMFPNLEIIKYKFEGDTFNPSLALNIGVKNAQFDNIIITCPEVLPLTDIFKQLESECGNNVICQVFDQNKDGSIGLSLVNSNYRSDDPSMYFLAKFNKKDIEKINGWDLEFMKGYAWEDSDFGARFVRAGIPFKVRDDIQALHQWHPRGGANSKGWGVNKIQFELNNKNGVIECDKGLRQTK